MNYYQREQAIAKTNRQTAFLITAVVYGLIFGGIVYSYLNSGSSDHNAITVDPQADQNSHYNASVADSDKQTKKIKKVLP